MAVPKQRKSRGRSNNRRMHLFITPASLALCSKCQKPVLPHTACKNCGYYKGKEVINVLGKLEKKERKKREKEMKEVEKENKQTAPLTTEDLSKK